MFSGEKNGRVKTRAVTADIKSILRLLKAAAGTGWIGMREDLMAARWVLR